MLTAPRAERHESIDVLRGVAVLGIFMMNIQAFAMVFQAYGNPPVHMDFSGANQLVWKIQHVFFEMKFITIFSALFGAGIVLMVGEEKDRQAVGRHYRRMLWLLLFGAVHAYVIWYGDILFPYAVWGMVAVLMRGMSARRLFVVGFILFALGALLMWLQYWSLPYAPKEAIAPQFAPSPELVQEIVAAQQAGGLERLANNAGTAAFAQIGGVIFFGPRVLGAMLLGMALFKWGFFTNRWPAASYLVGALLTIPIGWAAAWWGATEHIEAGFALEGYATAGMANFLFSPLAAFGYGCVVMLLCKPAALRAIRVPFAAAGRMALTNYLMQSLIAVYIFAGPPGLGQFGQWERTEQAQLVLAVWAFQLIVSPLWLAAFRFGPFEWLWRSLTYGKLQPLRKAPPAAAA